MCSPRARDAHVARTSRTPKTHKMEKNRAVGCLKNDKALLIIQLHCLYPARKGQKPAQNGLKPAQFSGFACTSPLGGHEGPIMEVFDYQRFGVNFTLHKTPFRWKRGVDCWDCQTQRVRMESYFLHTAERGRSVGLGRPLA